MIVDYFGETLASACDFRRARERWRARLPIDCFKLKTVAEERVVQTNGGLEVEDIFYGACKHMRLEMPAILSGEYEITCQQCPDYDDGTDEVTT